MLRGHFAELAPQISISFLSRQTEENANEDEVEEVNVNVNNQLDDEDGVLGGGESKIFDDRKWGVVLPPKCVHVDDMLGEVRLWLRNHASKKIAWTTPILYGGHVAAHDGPEFARSEGGKREREREKERERERERERIRRQERKDT